MSVLDRLSAWIAAPLQGNERDTPIAASVQWVAIVYGATALVAVAAIELAFAEPGWRLYTALGCFALLAASLWLVRHRQVPAGAGLLVATCWLPLVFAVAMTNGVSLSAQSGFVLAICSAGLLLGRRAAFVVAALSALVGPIFGGLQLRSGLPSTSDSASFSYGLWLMQAAIFASTAAMVSITLMYAQRSLERAQRSERRFRTIADNIRDVIIEYDSQDRFVYANPVFLQRRNKHSLEELADKRIGYTIHPDDLERASAEIRRARDTGGSASFTTKIATEQGGVAIVDATAGGFVAADGERRVVVVSRDVTEHHRVEEALRDSEERYRMLTEHAPDMIVEHDAEGRIIYANSAAREHGYWPTDGSEGSFGDWNHPDDIEACRQAFVDAMTSGRVRRLVHRMRQKDGSYHWVSSSGAPYRTSRGEMHMIGQSRDISEEVALQEQLRQAQKMEAIGRLAGGVAHDFNNLLTVIAGYAELLLAPESETDTALAAREIGAAAERAAGLTRQLLALSRRQLAKTVTLDLNEVVRGLEPVLRRTLPESIQIELALDPELPPVQADPSQLDQVLLNLALNARDAMPSRGRLRIETRAGEGGRSLHLSVSDTGVGMSDETRLRAFEPFFTTKPAGEGSGLGLSTTYGIVQQCGGSIALESAPGCGTRVAIELPAASVSAPARQAPPGAARHVVSRAAASILLVEDDPSVRRLLTLMLESSGYRVRAAASGDEALELVSSPGIGFDLLLTDYVLPGLSGVELCVALRARWPELRLLVMTGHAEIPPAGAAELPEGAELLGKPFAREQLGQLLERLLGSA